MKLLIVLCLILGLQYTSSQNLHTLNGKVHNEKNNLITIGDVLLLKNDSIVKYTYINNGEFLLNEIPEGNYTLKIAALGYEKHIQEIVLNKTKTLTIILKEATTALEEVEIKATKKLIENKNGNLKINVESTILSQESDAISLLSKLPSLQISNNGEIIHIIGKGNPLIYVENQKITIDELQSLSVDNIKSIELINNPSSRYEAEGRALLLITKKRNHKQGIKGSLIEKASFKTFFNNYLNTNLNLKLKTLEFKFDVAHNKLKIWESNGLDYSILNKNITSDYIVEAITNRTQTIVGGGIHYQFNNNDYLSINSRFRVQKEPFIIDTNTSFNDNGLENSIKSFSDNKGRRQFSSSNINYFNEFKTSNLFFGLQYTTLIQDIDNNITNTYESPFSETASSRSQNFDINTLSGRLDYTVSFKNDLKLESGINYNKTKSKSLTTTSNILDYEYNEKLLGFYTQLASNSNKVNFSLGLRVESASLKGGFKNESELLINGNNTYLFPKGSINFSLDSTKTINLNYAKSITRPNYSTATTSSAFINPFLEFQGNINLKPTLTDEISVNYQVKNKSITLRYYYMNEPVYYRLSFSEQDNLSIMSPKNFDKEYGLSLDLNIPIKYKFWTSNTSLSFNYNTIEDQIAEMSSTSPYLYYYSNHTFNINNNNNSININGWGLTNRKEGIFNREALFVINTSFTTKLLQKLNFTINFNDIFNSMEFKERYFINNIKAKSIFYTDVNEISFSLKYHFGALKKSLFKNKNVDDNLNRVK